MAKMEKNTSSNDLVYKEIVRSDIQEISVFLNKVFKTQKFSIDYLDKIYFDQDSVLGYNVFSGSNIIAHYCVVKRLYTHRDREYEIGWSVNTAVDKAFRGRGFFVDLAKRSYRLASERGIVAIVGVANRNSTRLFLEKLGFQDNGLVRWHVDLLMRYRPRVTFPQSFSHLNFKQLIIGDNRFLLKLPFIKIYSNREFSILTVYLTNRKKERGIGFSLPQRWFKSNWQVISLNLKPDDKGVLEFLKAFSIDIGESDTF